MEKYCLLLLLTISCNVKNLEAPGAIVPPTTDQDPKIPQISIQVSGHTRSIHLQTFGNSTNPPVFILHGGPGADFRLLLPLKALADSFYVVMWDSRGAGLSERITKKELSLESFDEEVAQVKAAIVPDKKIIFIGHSFGAAVGTRFAARHPGDVSQLILIEPGKLDFNSQGKSDGGAVSFFDGQDFFWQNETLTSGDHASADYKAIDLLPRSARNWTCDGSVVKNYPFWRFGVYHYHIVQKNTRRAGSNLNWSKDIESFKGKISLVCGSCGALGESFQRKTNLPIFSTVNLRVIQGAGHLSLFTEYKEQTISVVRHLLR